MPSMSILTRSRPLISKSPFFKSISTFPFLSQHPLISDDPPPPSAAESPPQPPFSASNWRNPNPNSGSTSPTLTPLTIIQSTAQTSDAASLMNLFADWMTSQRWNDMKNMFEVWIRSLDKNGKPYKPDVGLYNHYLRANLMIGASAGVMLDLVEGMEGFGIVPNTASFNLVLKAMAQGRETKAADKLLERFESF
ncbi:hypothetical protein LIER_43823 [Lithospermum erythrorhizon]|uniref:Pentatricopeptide repeat-containing protein n=1 Tax=Lithospermum erythrorhizon TaxID=34254 RepID=A0AAV3QYB7_LITER